MVNIIEHLRGLQMIRIDKRRVLITERMTKRKRRAAIFPFAQYRLHVAANCARKVRRRVEFLNTTVSLVPMIQRVQVRI